MAQSKRVHRPKPGATSGQTKLAYWRLKRGVTQKEMWKATGMAEATYRRLERGEIANPHLRHLVNCAIALGVELEDLVEDDWRQWLPLDARRSEPPRHERFWRPHPDDED